VQAELSTSGLLLTCSSSGSAIAVGMYSISEIMPDLQGSHKNDSVENCVAGKATEFGR
jgi:hypothetical protein